MSGSESEKTASRNRFGQYLRKRATPVQPRTARQIAARERLATLSAAWSTLSDAQRAQWDVYAASHPRTDSLGSTITLTGHQMFVGFNCALLNAGLNTIVVPPAGPDPEAPNLYFTSSHASSLDLNGFSLTLGQVGVISVSPPVSAGRNFNGDYRFLVAVPGAPTPVTVVTLAGAMEAKFGAVPAGKKIFVEAYVVSQNGWSAVSRTSTVIVPEP
jgi:hypothetical protein